MATSEGDKTKTLKTLNRIFADHNKRAQDKTRALAVEAKARQHRALELGKYATTVLEPQLRRLGKVVEENGHKAVVYVTGAIADDGSPSRAMIRVIPAGQETRNSDRYHPSLQFEMSAQHPQIHVIENAVFGGVGSSRSAGAFLPAELTSVKIEALFVDLMARTFK